MINSLKQGVRFPFEVRQFDKSIVFQYKNMQYTKGVKFLNPNINQALHHYLINTKGNFIKSLLTKNKIENTQLNIGLLNNIVYTYIAKTKYSTKFLETATMQYQLLHNSLIADRTLLSAFNYQYLSKMNYIFSSETWQNLDEISKIIKLHEYESNVCLDMLKISDETINNLINEKILPNKLNLENNIEIFKNIIEASYQISKDYLYQYDNLKFKNGDIDKETICQICYDISTTQKENKTFIELDCLVADSNILKSIDLEDKKQHNFDDVIKKIKEENELFNVDLKNLYSVKKK